MGSKIVRRKTSINVEISMDVSCWLERIDSMKHESRDYDVTIVVSFINYDLKCEKLV